MPVTLPLTVEDLEVAYREARRRQAYNEERKLRGRNRAPAVGDKALAMHRLGCVGELVVAQYLGLEEFLYRDEGPVAGSADLPGGIDVKTRGNPTHDLLIQLNDDPNKFFVLVTYEGLDSATIVGWIRGYECMSKKWVRELVRGRPCYAVPQRLLHPIETLLEHVSLPGGRRILGSHEAWVQKDDDSLVLCFTEEVAASLGWSAGEVLVWEVDPATGACIVRKRPTTEGA